MSKDAGTDDQHDGVTPEAATTKVSTVILGVLSARNADINQNEKDRNASGDNSDNEDCRAGEDAANAEEAVPEIEPRVVKQAEHRKSKDIHQYENVHLSTDVQIDSSKESASPVEHIDTCDRHDDTLSLPDSIEGNPEKVCTNVKCTISIQDITVCLYADSGW